ncbi:MAG: hypothetical protein U0136_16050 [Bdellovibrionota bacterium]
MVTVKYNLTNSVWSGVVGKDDSGDPKKEQFISLRRMLQLTAAAEYRGRKFTHVDLICLPQHIDLSKGPEAEAVRVAALLKEFGLKARSIVPFIWCGSAMGTPVQRAAFVKSFNDALLFGAKLVELGVRDAGDGVFRLDTSCSPQDFADGGENAFEQIVDTVSACVAAAHALREFVALEQEVCWGGLDNATRTIQLIDRCCEVFGGDAPIGLQGDLSHLMGDLLGVDRVLGYNTDTAKLPEGFKFDDAETLESAWGDLAEALATYLVDFHAAQNNGTVHGSGSHAATMKHCLPFAADGVIDHKAVAPLWLIDEDGEARTGITGLTWDGCMFSNDDLENPGTWNDVLRYLVEIEDSVNAKLAESEVAGSAS